VTSHGATWHDKKISNSDIAVAVFVFWRHVLSEVSVRNTRLPVHSAFAFRKVQFIVCFRTMNAASINFSGLTVICPVSEVVRSEFKVFELSPCMQHVERLRTSTCNPINWQRIERLSNECNFTNFTIGSVLEDPALLKGYIPKDHVFTS
jgi:hypothetical protein